MEFRDRNKGLSSKSGMSTTLLAWKADETFRGKKETKKAKGLNLGSALPTRAHEEVGPP